MNTNSYMQLALDMAKKAEEQDLVPVGCIIVHKDKVISTAHNGSAPFEHAEYLAIKNAYEILEQNIRDAEIYVTLEPCMMCTGMIALCGIQTVVFGAYDTKNGGIDHRCIPTFKNTVGGIMEGECGQLLSEYFQKKR